MTTKNKTEETRAREFFVNVYDKYDNFFDCVAHKDKSRAIEDVIPTRIKDTAVHVIEYSAFLDMKMQMEEAIAGREQWKKTQDENKKLKERVEKLEADVEQYERASAAQSRQWEKLRQENAKLREGISEAQGRLNDVDTELAVMKEKYAELLEQANKLEEALRFPFTHFTSYWDDDSGELMESNKNALAQFAEWKSKNK